MIEKICDEIKSTLIAKNQNYGNSSGRTPIFAPGLTAEDALFVRLSDKVARLAELRKGEPDRVGEALEDTVADMAGYCVLILRERRGNKDGNTSR